MTKLRQQQAEVEEWVLALWQELQQLGELRSGEDRKLVNCALETTGSRWTALRRRQEVGELCSGDKKSMESFTGFVDKTRLEFFHTQLVAVILVWALRDNECHFVSKVYDKKWIALEKTYGENHWGMLFAVPITCHFIREPYAQKMYGPTGQCEQETYHHYPGV